MQCSILLNLKWIHGLLYVPISFESKVSVFSSATFMKQ